MAAEMNDDPQARDDRKTKTPTGCNIHVQTIIFSGLCETIKKALSPERVSMLQTCHGPRVASVMRLWSPSCSS